MVVVVNGSKCFDHHANYVDRLTFIFAKMSPWGEGEVGGLGVAILRQTLYHARIKSSISL